MTKMFKYIFGVFLKTGTVLEITAENAKWLKCNRGLQKVVNQIYLINTVFDL